MIDYLYEREKAEEKREARREWFSSKVEEFITEICSELELDWDLPHNRSEIKEHIEEVLKERRPMPEVPISERAMKTEYPIWTINDIMEIPMERFHQFLHEFSQVLTIARTAHAYNKAMGCKEPTISKPFIWINDGKGEIRTNITWKKKEGGG